MSALDRLAAHDKWMRSHHRSVARDLLPDLELIAFEAVFRELPEGDTHALALAIQTFERIARDES
jgi:hypothetical protein